MPDTDKGYYIMKKGFILYYLCFVGMALVSCTNKVDKALLEYQTAIEEQEAQKAAECHEYIQSIDRTQMTMEQYGRFEQLSRQSDTIFARVALNALLDSLESAIDNHDYAKVERLSGESDEYKQFASAEQFQRTIDLLHKYIDVAISDVLTMWQGYIQVKNKVEAQKMQSAVLELLKQVGRPSDDIYNQYLEIEKAHKETFKSQQSAEKVPADLNWIYGTWRIDRYASTALFNISKNRFDFVEYIQYPRPNQEEFSSRWKVLGNAIQLTNMPALTLPIDRSGRRIGIKIGDSKTEWAYKTN